jgi:hypothetical protein
VHIDSGQQRGYRVEKNEAMRYWRWNAMEKSLRSSAREHVEGLAKCEVFFGRGGGGRGLSCVKRGSAINIREA